MFYAVNGKVYLGVQKDSGREYTEVTITKSDHGVHIAAKKPAKPIKILHDYETLSIEEAIARYGAEAAEEE